MHLLDLYIARHIWAAVAIVLLVILGLDVMIAFGSELDALDKGANLKQVLTYIVLTVPRRVYEFMPLTVLVGCLVGWVDGWVVVSMDGKPRHGKSEASQ